MLMFRAGYYDTTITDGVTEVIPWRRIAMVRPGTAKIHFEGKFTRFSNLDTKNIPIRMSLQ